MSNTQHAKNMYYERPELEKGSKKHICPKCGKKSLTRYVQYGKYIDDTVGICDKIINCAYHKPPREHWKENNIYLPIATSIIRNQIPKTADIKPIGYTPMQYVFDYAKNRNNDLIYYLLDLFDWETIKQRTDPYLLGSAKERAVIYWQIDENGKCRTGKIQKYDKDTGKRLKGKGAVNWVHDKLKRTGELPKDFNFKMCLFGLHLILSTNNAGKTICICESEKSALIAACCMPQYIWMAAGALSWLNVEKLKPLQGRNVILFPDSSTNGKAFELWAKVADEANRQGLNVVMSDMLEKGCSDEEKADGYDLGDYLIGRLLKLEQPKVSEVENPPEPLTQSTVLADMIGVNPVLAMLIDRFELVEV